MKVLLIVLLACSSHRLSAAFRVGLSDQRLKPDWVVVENAYAVACEKVGWVPCPIACTTNDVQLAAALDGIDLLILTGGADVDPRRYGAARHPTCGRPDPLRDEFELRLVAQARRRRLPIVGICRGLQILNVAFGGTLWQDLPSEFAEGGKIRHAFGSYCRPLDFPAAHTVKPESGSRLAARIGAADLAVNSHHHQAVRKVAPGFRVSARSPDGVIEAIEGLDYPAFGVQFHPEALVARAAGHETYDLPRLTRLFRALPSLCGRQAIRRRTPD